MLKTEKVSVVVPIYKVENYIHRCVNSILKQTYENLEIILVNDGSPDQCGEIAEGYKQSDSRVKVFHKENGGLSDARNHGMKQVTGEFTMFVDSDDWLEPYAIEKMVHHSLAFKADVIQSAFYYAHEDYLLFDQRHYTKNGDLMILDNEKLMHELVKNETVKNFAWGKLYKTKLIRDIPFEKGVLFEDVFWAHQVMHRVNMFIILHEPLYNYYQRDDSIVAAYTLRNLDILKGLKERHAFIESFYKELTDESYRNILKACLIHYNLLLINRKKDKGGYHRKEIQNYIKCSFGHLKEAVQNNKQLKLQLYLFNLYPYLNVLFLGITKMLRVANVFSSPVGLERVNFKK